MQWMRELDPPEPGSGRRIRVGLVGHGIAASRSPYMHMQEGRAQGLDYDYRLIDLAGRAPAPPMAETLGDLQAAGFDGLNVTYPYKQPVIPHLHRLSQAARAVGAVNTIVFRDGERHGHNTDVTGFRDSFRRRLPDARRDAVLLLGAGGAGSAVAAALLDEGVGRLPGRTGLSTPRP